MYNLEVPLNNVSFGQTSISIIRELFDRLEDFSVTPISKDRNIDISAQPQDELFNTNLDSALKKQNSYTDKCFKLWHINGSINQFGRKQVLLTFHETDELTQTEIDILGRTEHILVTSKNTEKLMLEAGLNVSFVNLGFDSVNFYPTNKKYYDDDRIVFMIVGKFEHRKRTAKTIQAWLQKFGNNRKYFLHVAAHNPFLTPEQMKSEYQAAIGNKVYWNIQFFDWMQTNAAFNDFLNAGHIMLGMSGSEAFGLPEFHGVALGKHSVIHNVNGYQSWATSENSVLVNPNNKIPAYDGKFFGKGQQFNQGNFYDWGVDMFIAGCEEAIRRYEKNTVNENGLQLQKTHTTGNLVSHIIDSINCL